MYESQRPLSPHLQVYRWQITMVLSILHRATGVALSVGLILLATWLVAAATGPEAYTRLRDVVGSVPGMIVTAGIVLSFCFHLCNGIRHLFWDAGVGFEKPQYYASGVGVLIASAALFALLAALAMGVLGGGS